MKRCIVGGSAAMLIAAGLIVSAPVASAGCQYGGPFFISKCDGPVQPDGTWQRCLATAQVIPRGASSYLVPDKNCAEMGPDQPWNPALADPPTHIDD
jgi:hypothetical protein